MTRKRARVIVVGMFAVAAMGAGAGCGPTNIANPPPPGSDGGPNPQRDGAVIDAPVTPGDGPAQEDAPPPVGDAHENPDSCVATTCSGSQLVNDGCGDHEICGDGLDNDCNGLVDDGCGCVPGAVQPCFKGPPGRRNVGACVDGTQRCEGSGEFGAWGECQGGIWPTTETCDTQDNDCNGCVDDDPRCCEAAINCPGPGDLPEAAPFADYTLAGTAYFTGAATSWKWEVTGGPCDQLLYSTTNKVSYTLNGQSTTSVTSATNSHVTFRPTLSGDYTFKLTVVTASGETLTCTFIVHVRGPGFRVEMCWDTTGQTDIDLHVHKPGTTTPWFSTTLTGTDTNNDDCYYMNCKPPATAMTGWGYANTSVDECKGAPAPGGATWTGLGYCRNPRLDIDNISTPGVAENANVDNPNDGNTFRVMVHYYSGSKVTHPLVNVYCGGRLTSTYGAAPDVVGGFSSGGSWGAGTMWRVADVTTHVTAGTTTGCDVTPLHPAGQTSGYNVTNNDRTY
ncbi:MAG TPA: MopE-related protein [Polyangia bacterium]|jgi:hypothetical protein